MSSRVSRDASPVVKLALVATSLLLCLGGFEIAARRAFLLPLNAASDGWWEVQWLKRGPQYGSGGSSIDKFDPRLGWTLREGLHDVPLLGATVNSNSLGMRGRREYPLAKTSALRIVVIGDSYTFGEGVNDGETFAAVLEQTLPAAEVLNLAVHGYGTDQQWLRLQIDGLKYMPDVVLFGFNDDDLTRDRLRFRDYMKPHFSVGAAGLALDNVPIPSPAAFRARPHLRMLDYLDIAMTALRDRHLEAENLVRSRLILDGLFADVRSIGATLVQVYLPTPDQVHANEADHPGLFNYGCAMAGVVCVDPTAAMHRIVAERQDWKTLFRYHYAPPLHRAIAEEIAAAISSKIARDPLN